MVPKNKNIFLQKNTARTKDFVYPLSSCDKIYDLVGSGVVPIIPFPAGCALAHLNIYNKAARGIGYNKYSLTLSIVNAHPNINPILPYKRRRKFFQGFDSRTAGMRNHGANRVGLFVDSLYICKWQVGVCYLSRVIDCLSIPIWISK